MATLQQSSISKSNLTQSDTPLVQTPIPDDEFDKLLKEVNREESKESVRLNDTGRQTLNNYLRQEQEKKQQLQRLLEGIPLNFQKGMKDNKIILETQPNATPDNWLELEKSCKRIFPKGDVKILTQFQQLENLINFALKSELKEKSLNEYFTTITKEYFLSKWLQATTHYPIKSYNVDIQEGIIDLVLDGDFKEFCEHDYQSTVLQIYSDLLENASRDYNEELKNIKQPSDMSLLNFSDLQLQPKLISLKEGSVCISIALWGTIGGIVAASVGIGMMIAYIIVKQQNKKKATVSLEQIEMDLNRGIRETMQRNAQINDQLGTWGVDYLSTESEQLIQEQQRNSQEIVKMQKQLKENRKKMIESLRKVKGGKMAFGKNESVYYEDDVYLGESGPQPQSEDSSIRMSQQVKVDEEKKCIVF